MSTFSIRRIRRRLTMHRLASVSTSLLFAAHVMLGCCVHHAHGHGSHASCQDVAIGDRGGCQSDPRDASQSLYHGADDCPDGPCSHGWCIYTKAEGPRVDRDGGQSLGSGLVLPPAGPRAADLFSPECVSIAAAEAPPTQLYLLHCALVI